MTDNRADCYRPPAVSRAQVRYNAMFGRKRIPLTLCDGITLHDGGLEWRGAWVCCEARIGGVSVTLHVPPPLLAALSEQQEAVIGTVTSEVQILTALLSLAECFATLEKKIGTEIRFLKIVNTARSPDGIKCALNVRGERWPLVLQAPASAIQSLMLLRPVAPLPEEEVFLRTFIRMGSTPLSLPVVSSLCPGDVVLLASGSPEKATFMIENHAYACMGWHEDNGWHLETAIQYPLKKEGRMAEREEDGRAEHISDGSDENMASEMDLPVTISFDMGHKTITLAELRDLGPGSVLELTSPVSMPIGLYVGGRKIGQGELVDVEGAAGVRIKRIFGRE
ncbi:type III secretion system cytoplasmic ring protein SctQ [Acetobacter indonesiensis]|uniref:Secretion system type III protein n=1 Tax=Acetobacter indonesiensis TaxID=104101 RepID=A0A6N3T880_9PROT|nr:type III secretion system cytoplasmic ring protein SctQ [Acetobacter indonesiensis]GAN61992.1 secretion system type III protein [Acetobacter indonesiensis]GEN04745.1 hypothetical protein AIN02nite_27700 [Acetobacter indonesiensis]